MADELKASGFDKLWPPPKKVSYTIYPSREQRDQLKELSRITKVPTSVYIREGIDLVLGRERQSS